MKKIDARGLSCPQPVLLTKNGVKESPSGVEVTVDSEVAKGNVKRFLENSGYKVLIEDKGEEHILSARK